jgi:hypothetical protein
VLSGRGEAARLIAGEVAGIVVAPENPRALAEALAQLAADPILRARMGAAGRAAVEREFGREQWLVRWSELLEGAAPRE